jgi:hypothetical protein
MKSRVIMHNIVVESEREEPVEDDQPYDHKGPLAELDQVLVKFSAFLAMHQEIHNRDEHNHLQEDLVEHLWTQEMLIAFIYFLFELLYEYYTFVLFVCSKL